MNDTIVIYTPINSKSNNLCHKQSNISTASCIATYAISNPISTAATASNLNNNQDDSPLLSFCSVTNTLLNQ